MVCDEVIILNTNVFKTPLFPQKKVFFLQETICNIEFEQDEGEFLAKLRTEMGGLREYTGRTFEEVLNLVMLELEEEFS